MIRVIQRSFEKEEVFEATTATANATNNTYRSAISRTMSESLDVHVTRTTFFIEKALGTNKATVNSLQTHAFSHGTPGVFLHYAIFLGAFDGRRKSYDGLK